MSKLTEARHTGSFILSEVGGHFSRENITLLSGENLKVGHVLGRKATAATVTGAAQQGNVGNGTIGTLTVGNAVDTGVYRAVINEPGSNVGEFTLYSPKGAPIGQGTVAAAYSGSEGPAFTIADGATDFAVGDSFLITVTGATFKYQEYNPADTDGLQYPVAILLDSTGGALAADMQGVGFVRACEVNVHELEWFSGATTNQKQTGVELLQAIGIVAR